MAFKWFQRGLAAFGIAAATSCATPVPAPPTPRPALWKVADADTTIYLFGTVHALDGKQAWLNDEVATAFDASDELVLEVITPDDPKEIAPLLARYATNADGPTLTSKLSPRGQSALVAALKRHGLPATAFDRYKPFFASVALSALDFDTVGFTSQDGAEAVLRKRAAAEHKALGAVETMERQMSFFDALSEPQQIALLEDSLKDSSDDVDKELTRLVGAWGRGDADQVAAILREADVDNPALYKLLLVDRNRQWAEWIDRRMKQPGTVFMAVGAGHLAGPDSVQHFLKVRGIRSARVPHAD